MQPVSADFDDVDHLDRFEPSEVARQREASQGNIKAEDMVPVIRKRSGPGGELSCY